MNNWTRKIVVVFVSGMMLAGSTHAVVSADSLPDQLGVAHSQVTMKEPVPLQPVTIMLNGTRLKHQGVQGQEGVLLPIELIRTELKVPVNVDSSQKKYTMQRGNVVVELVPSDLGAQAIVNGSTQILPYEWKEIGGQPYVSAAVLSDHLGYTSTSDPAAHTLNLVPHELNDITIITKKISETIPEASITVEYPQIKGMKNVKAEKSINAIFQSKAQEFVQRSVKEAKDNQPSPNDSKYEYIGNYTVTFNRGGLLSILLQTYSYSGGAHGISVREGLTFRLQDGKRLSLDELLKDNPNYRQIIDPAIAKKLEQTDGYFGNFKTIGENPSYYLKDDGVVIFFQLYEYLPYAFGFPEYYFPFAELLPSTGGTSQQGNKR